MAELVVVPSYGVEIELDYGLRHAQPKGWVSGYDGSLRSRRYYTGNYNAVNIPVNVDGVELLANDYDTCEMKSDVLKGSDEFKSAMVSSLDWARQDCNSSCGLHIHVGFCRVFSTGTVRSINLPKLAAEHQDLMTVLSDAGKTVHEWVVARDATRVGNRFCYFIRHGHDTLAIREYGRNGQSFGLLYNGYADTLLRPKYNTVEFRSPSPRVDRAELAELVAEKVDTQILPVVKECLVRKKIVNA